MAQAKDDLRYIVRIANTDLDGKKPIGHALLKIRGVGFMFANAVCRLSKIVPTKKAGELTGDEIEKMNSVLKDPSSGGLPTWMLNRRNDVEEGKTAHLLTGDLVFATQNDIKRLKKVRSYRGVRHSFGLPVRGQRTKSNFRRNKGKGLGVIRKKVQPSATGDKK